MSLATITTADVMDSAAALLNDTAKSAFTYTAQLPYLNIALAELREALETNNIAYTNEVVSGIKVVAGALRLEDSQLPINLVEIQKISERDYGVSEAFIQLRRMEFLPDYVTQITSLIYWTWQDQTARFIGATSDRELKIEYIASRLPKATKTDGTDEIRLINAQTFLGYRTASLCARFIGENPARGDELDKDAQMAYDRFMIINTKARQSLATRHRPFNASYKRFSIW